MTIAGGPGHVGVISRLRTHVRDLFLRRATWVLIDQAVVSGGNFLTLNALLRYLQREEWGAFNVLFETMMYLNSLQAALVIYPLTLKGATSELQKSELTDLGRLATASIILTAALLPILASATVGALFFVEKIDVAVAGVAALFLWQLQETMRRGLMSNLRFAGAVWGDAIRYLGQTVAVFLIAWSGALTLNLAFLVMGATAAAGIALQAWQIGLKPIRIWQLRLVMRDFWRLGRWMLMTNASGFITALGYWYMLTWAWGKDSTAVFGAIIYPFKLVNPIMTSMSGLIVPVVAQTVNSAGMRQATRAASRYIALGGAMLLPYFLVLLLFPRFMLGLFSGYDSPYVTFGMQLQLFVLNYVMVYLSAVIGAWLAGLGRVRWCFYAQVTNIIATLAIGLPLTYWWGVNGLILGGLISAGTGTAASALFILRAARITNTAANP